MNRLPDGLWQQYVSELGYEVEKSVHTYYQERYSDWFHYDDGLKEDIDYKIKNRPEGKWYSEGRHYKTSFDYDTYHTYSLGSSSRVELYYPLACVLSEDNPTLLKREKCELLCVYPDDYPRPNVKLKQAIGYKRLSFKEKKNLVKKLGIHCSDLRKTKEVDKSLQKAVNRVKEWVNIKKAYNL